MYLGHLQYKGKPEVGYVLTDESLGILRGKLQDTLSKFKDRWDVPVEAVIYKEIERFE